MWHELWIAVPALLRGLAVTLELSAAVILLGSTIGYLGGLSLEYGPKPLWAAVRVYVDTLRGIPVLVLLFAVFYGLPIVGIQIGAFGAGVVALSVFAGAHMTEVVRGGIASIPRTQGDAAKAIGLEFWERLRWVILPQAVRRAGVAARDRPAGQARRSGGPDRRQRVRQDHAVAMHQPPGRV